MEFLEKFGIEWKLLLAQAVNFLVLAVILRAFAYKPLINFLDARRKKIEEGLENARLAEQKLGEAEDRKKEKVREGESKAMEIIAEGEKRGRETETRIMGEAAEKEKQLLQLAEKRIKDQYAAEKNNFYKEAVEIIRMAVAKAAAVDLEKIDGKLMGEAVKDIKRTGIMKREV